MSIQSIEMPLYIFAIINETLFRVILVSFPIFFNFKFRSFLVDWSLHIVWEESDFWPFCFDSNRIVIRNINMLEIFMWKKLTIFDWTPFKCMHCSRWLLSLSSIQIFVWIGPIFFVAFLCPNWSLWERVYNYTSILSYRQKCVHNLSNNNKTL